MAEVSMAPYSSAFGYRNLIANSAQLVAGKFNQPLTDAIFIIGNGTNDNNRSNALWLDLQGNLHIAGDLLTNNNVKVIEVILQQTMDSNEYIANYDYNEIITLSHSSTNIIIGKILNQDTTMQYTGFFTNGTFLIITTDDNSKLTYLSFRYNNENQTWYQDIISAGEGSNITYTLEQIGNFLVLQGSDGSESIVEASSYDDSEIRSIIQNLAQTLNTNYYTKDETYNLDEQVLNEAESYADVGDINTLTSAQDYTNTQIDNMSISILNEVRSYFEFLENYSEEEF